MGTQDAIREIKNVIRNIPFLRLPQKLKEFFEHIKSKEKLSPDDYYYLLALLSETLFGGAAAAIIASTVAPIVAEEIKKRVSKK